MAELVGLTLFGASILGYIGARNILNEVRVEELWIYPIKGLKGIKVESVTMSTQGFQFDRMLMIAKDGKFQSQRTHPKMALIDTRLDVAKNTIIVSARGQDSFNIPLMYQFSSEEPTVTVNVWGTDCNAIDCGDDAAEWFSRILGTENLRLVRMSPTCNRRCEMTETGLTSFADMSPVLLAAKESLVHLNSQLTNAVAQINFRPNLVVRGILTPFAEDFWTTVQVGTAQFLSAQPCSRCKVPTNDPSTGVMDAHNEPTRSMTSFRKGEDIGLHDKKRCKQIYYGLHLDHAGIAGGVISLGDTVRYTKEERK